MLKKNKIQTYISTKKIYIAQTEFSGSGKININFSVFGDIKTLVKDRQLIEIKGARQLLKTMLSQRKEKTPPEYCDLCLPDSYFLSKVIKLPDKKLDDDGVHDFIIKQADKDLPTNTKDLYLRWKYFSKEGKSKLVLLTAIARKYLDPIIDLFAQEKIDIFRVKPLSYVLANIINKTESNNYIIQVFNGESVLTVLTVNQKVIFSTEELSSSSLPNKDLLEKGISKTRQFISGLNVTIKVDKLYLLGFKTGPKSNPNLEQIDAFKPVYLEDKLSFQGKKTTEDIALIALSGFSIIEEDAVNFLPSKDQKSFAKKQLLGQTYKSIYIFALGFLFLLAIVSYYSMNMYFNLKAKQRGLDSARNNRISQSEREAEQQAIQINKKTQVLAKLYSQKTNSQKTMDDFYKLVPAGINVVSFDYSLEKKSINISGVAYNREDLLAFKQKLKQLGQVHLPITSFIKKNNLSFKLSIVLP